MKVFLLFLVVSFIVGSNQPEITRARQYWLMGALVVVMGLAYFFFDGLI